MPHSMHSPPPSPPVIWSHTHMFPFLPPRPPRPPPVPVAPQQPADAIVTVVTLTSPVALIATCLLVCVCTRSCCEKPDKPRSPKRPAGVAPIRIQPKLCLASSVDVNQKKEEDEVTVEDLQSESDYAEGTRKSQLQQQHARAVQTTYSTVQRQRPREAWM